MSVERIYYEQIKKLQQEIKRLKKQNKKLIDKLDKDIKKFQEDYVRFSITDDEVKKNQKVLGHDPYEQAFVVLYVDYVLNILINLRKHEN